MIKPVGGRGKKAPYETVMVRTPIPVKPQVEKLIENYKASISVDGNVEFTNSKSSTIDDCIELVIKFIDERDLSDKLETPRRFRDVVELARFIDWLQSMKCADESDML